MDSYNNVFINGMNNYLFKKIFGHSIKRVTCLIEEITKEKLVGKIEYEHVSEVSGGDAKSIDGDIIVSATSLESNYRILVDVEAQNYNMGDRLIKRQYHYVAMFLAGMYEKNSFYEEDRKLVIIFLHSNRKNNGNPISITQGVKSPENKQIDIVKIYDVFLDEFFNIDLQEVSKNDKILVELMRVLIANDIDEYLKSDNEVVREVASMIDYLNKNEKERIAAIKKGDYENRVMLGGYNKGKEEGRQEGKIEGANSKEIEIAKSMSINGYSNEEIAKILNKDISTIEETLRK